MNNIDDNTPRVDVVDFDTSAAHKNGLPIGVYVAETTTIGGEDIILRANHVLVNESSSHTLLCVFQMRENGLIVDDVSKIHIANSSGIKRT